MVDTKPALLAIDPLSRTITCSLKRWNDHIASRHCDLTNHLDWVTDTITRPWSIYKDAVDDNCIVYYSKSPAYPLYVRVVVRLISTKNGEVITAHLTSNGKKGEKLLWTPK
jgi:hypothetical protein